LIGPGGSELSAGVSFTSLGEEELHASLLKQSLAWKTAILDCEPRDIARNGGSEFWTAGFRQP
jgi:hypothetical protein